MGIGHPLIIFGADRPLFAINQGESFTVPQGISVTSPTSQYQPAGVAGTFNDTRPTAGGQTLLAISDAAGPNKVTELELELQPGDVIALGAVAGGASNLTINGVVVYTITGVTTFAAVVGLYG
jgi:hypothetical protein